MYDFKSFPSNELYSYVTANTMSYQAFHKLIKFLWSLVGSPLSVFPLFFFFFLPTVYLEFGSRTTLLLKKYFLISTYVCGYFILLFLCQNCHLALLSIWYPNSFLVCIYRQQLEPFTFLVLQNQTRWVIVLFPYDCNNPLHQFFFAPLKTM